MRWLIESRGEKIEEFIDTMCIKFPDVMAEVLSIGFGDLGAWFEGDERRDTTWRNATCGCLVGATALACTRKIACAVPTIETIEIADEMTFNAGEGPDVLYVAIMCANNRKPYARGVETDSALHSLIYGIGMDAFNETADCSKNYDVRNDEVVRYMLDRIAVNLDLLKFPRPKTY